MFSALSLVALTGFAFQAATPVNSTGGLIPAAPPEAPSAAPISPELRGDVMMARKMYREAIDFYKPGSDTSPVLANKTGIAYHQLEDLADARKYYQKALKLKPDYAEAINNLGTVYYAQKSYRRAIREYKKALRLQPDSASFLSNLAAAYLARKDYKDSLETYQKALAIDPDVLDRHSNEGTIIQDQTVEERARYDYFLAKNYAKAGEKDRALQHMRKALEEGFKDREKFVKDPEFSALQDDPTFKEILATEQKVL